MLKDENALLESRIYKKKNCVKWLKCMLYFFFVFKGKNIFLLYAKKQND